MRTRKKNSKTEGQASQPLGPGVVDTEGLVDREQVRPYWELVCWLEKYLAEIPNDQEVLVKLRPIEQDGILEETVCFLMGGDVVDMDDLRANLDDYRVAVQNAVVSGTPVVEVFCNGNLVQRHRPDEMFEFDYVYARAAEVAYGRRLAACRSLQDLRDLGFATISDEEYASLNEGVA